MLDAMRADERDGHVATLGIEAPLWLPVPRDDETRLATGRKGDGNRSCFAPVGGYVTTLGMHELAHILQRLPKTWTPTLLWRDWNREDPRRLLLWEAFVAGPAHSKKGDANAHLRDAATAAVEMLRRVRAGALTNDVDPEAESDEGQRDVLSIAGAVLLWSRRSKDLSVLRQAPLVVRPKERFRASAIDRHRTR